MRLEYLVAGKRPLHPIREALQGLDHTALPVDQGAIAVEGECIKIRKQHAEISSFTVHNYARLARSNAAFSAAEPANIIAFGPPIGTICCSIASPEKAV